MSKRCRFGLGCCLTALLMFACSGKDTVYRIVLVQADAGPLQNSGGAAGNGAAGSMSFAGSSGTSGDAGTSVAGTGGPGGDAGVSGGAGTAGSSGTSGAAGQSGASGQSGTSSSSGTAGEAGMTGFECFAGMACPPSPNVCGAFACIDNLCQPIVDQNHTPTPASTCLIGTCNSAGEPGTAPGPAGTACVGGNGAKVCDGLGNCVQCMQTSDCAAGQVCAATRRCQVALCTDVDCGGACPPCLDGKKCLADVDCASAACDAASHVCVANECTDHRQDGLETDADCGGGICKPCELAKSCQVSSDCASMGCDALTLRCVSDACSDHRQDGYETDIDCGGLNCKACGVGLKCGSNFDCVSGHFCSASKVCQ